jgi:hypothetical protein
MKRKTTIGSGVGEDVVPKCIIDEDRHAKRLGVEDTGSGNSDSEGLGDGARTLWLLHSSITLKEKRVHNCGVRV